MVFCILSSENVLGNRLIAKEKRGWHRYGTCQMGSNAKVSDSVVKVKKKLYELQRAKRMYVKEMIDNKAFGIKSRLGPLGVKTRLFIPEMWSLSESGALPPGIQQWLLRNGHV